MSDPRIQGSNGLTGDAFLDAESGAIPVIDLSHAAIHDGKGFSMFLEDTDFDIAVPIYFDILTPAAPHIHLKSIGVYHSATSAVLEVLEAPTITPGTNAIPIINLNRNKAAVVSGVSAFDDPSGISDGTVLLSATLETGSPVAPIVDLTTEREIILKASARTLVSLTSAQDNQLGRVSLFFYIDRDE